MKHLRKERKLTIEKSSPGVYHINKETFSTQIIVTCELPPAEHLYLHCLTDKLQNVDLINQLASDYKQHQEDLVYTRYMHQLTIANVKMKGESPMVCEGILNLCGTSSEEIIERTKKEDAEYYLPKIDNLSSVNKQLASQIDYLKSLLEQNNIPFHLEPETEMY